MAVIRQEVQEKELEQLVSLAEDLDMIHSCKEYAYHDMSVVSRAVFEMRLNRIHFSVDDGLDMPRE